MNNHFAAHGCEKMIYDIRMGPVALSVGDRITVVYHANSAGGVALPHLIEFDKNRRVWTEPVALGEPPHYDHHFAPILWMDAEDRYHVIYGAHGAPHSSVHLVSGLGGSASRWTDGPEIAESITYPRVVHFDRRRALCYYRVFGHMGYWTYRRSEDGGGTWAEDAGPVVDFDQAPQSSADTWSGSYHAVAPARDGRCLHVGFVYWDERRLENPVYGLRTRTNTRYNLYYVKIDTVTGRCCNAFGEEIAIPITRSGSEPCLIWDTAHRLTNMPAIYADRQDKPILVLPVSESSPWDCSIYCVRESNGEWIKSPITDTNHTWSGCLLTGTEGGDLRAWLTAGRSDGADLAYGGGAIEEWRSGDGGETWLRHKSLIPDEGYLYNNPRLVESQAGASVDDYLLFYGWPGEQGIQPDDLGRETGAFTGKAYLWHRGEFMGTDDGR